MKFETHGDYVKAAPYVKLVRDCIEGEPTIKRERTIYLKNPDMLDTTSSASLNRYDRYLDGAEFDGYSGETERTMLGKMRTGKPEIDLPEKLEYLIENIDCDGTPLDGLVETLYKNTLEVKFHVLLAEMGNLGDTDTESLSVADVQALNLKATVKSYTRESLIDWDFRRINGVQQLSLMVLKEVSTVRSENYTKKSVASYLVLGLDENGEYYQEKYVESEGDNDYSLEGERVYPEAGKSKINFIPAHIVFDEEIPAGCIPKGLGYLYPICASDLYRYRASAQYSEAREMLQPTTFTKGWKQGDEQIFKDVNEGREGIRFGSGVCNNLPRDVSVEVVSLGFEDQAFIRYFELNTQKIRALGGKVDDGDTQGNRSATEASINSRDRTAVMESIVGNVEAGLSRVISYCGMYMGLWKPEEVEDALEQIAIEMPREFGKAKMSPEEQAAVANNLMAGLYSKDEALRILVAGGVTVSDAETITGELEQSGPEPIRLPAP